jgi:hypothetical protein
MELNILSLLCLHRLLFGNGFQSVDPSTTVFTSLLADDSPYKLIKNCPGYNTSARTAENTPLPTILPLSLADRYLETAPVLVRVYKAVVWQWPLSRCLFCGRCLETALYATIFCVLNYSRE